MSQPSLLVGIGLCAIALCAAATPARAAAPAAAIGEPLRDGDTSIVGKLPAGAMTSLVAVRIDGSDATISRITPRIDGSRFRVRLNEPLRAGQTVDLRYFSGVEWSDWSAQATVQARRPTDFLYAYDEDDNPFVADAFLAVNFDNFSAFDPNQPSSGPTLTVTTQPRMTAGFNLEYRILGGHAHSERQAWIFSRLIYAARSGEELCTQDPNSSQVTCLIGQEPQGRLGEFTRIVQHARTFESLSGIRWDVLTVQPASNTPTKLFLFGQGGPLLFAGTERPRNQWTVGGGLRIPEGRFAETKIEIGVGGTDYFTKHFPRVKVHGFLAFPLAGALRFFGEVRSDANVDAFTGGNDSSLSLITVMGLHLEVADLFKR